MFAQSASATGERADVLVIGWGSTYGPINAACQIARRGGVAVGRGVDWRLISQSDEPGET